MSAAGGEPVADQRRAAIRNAGFGVELHAVYRQIPVIKGHDVPRFIVRTCDQLFGHRVRIDDPRMVASYDQGRSDFLQQQIARIGYGQHRRMPVQRGRQLSQFGSERPGERLMSQTDPQHGDSLPHDLSDRRHKVARLFRDSGARREEYPVVIAEFFEVDPVVELYRNIHRFGRFPKQLYGVVDERVVIIDYQYLFHGYKSNLFYTFAE